MRIATSHDNSRNCQKISQHIFYNHSFSCDNDIGCVLDGIFCHIRHPSIQRHKNYISFLCIHTCNGNIFPSTNNNVFHFHLAMLVYQTCYKHKLKIHILLIQMVMGNSFLKILLTRFFGLFFRF